MKSFSRAALGCLAGLALLIAGYALAGWVGGLIPVNPGWTPPTRGIAFYVEDNGIHTGLVLPKLADGVSIADLAPASDLRDPRYAGHGWLAIGWGERDFYLNTPTWSQVSPRTLIGAATGSNHVLLHVEHVPEPRVDAQTRRIVVRPAEYRRLVARVRASFVPGARRYPGYDRYDSFYDARGHYSALHSCNGWTGETLAAAGVRVGRWTPFPGGVMRWF